MSTYMMGTFAGSGVAYALGAYVVGRYSAPGRMMVPLVGEVFPWQVVFFIVGLPGLLVALLALTISEPRRRAATAQTTAQTTAQAASQQPIPFAEFLAYVRRNAHTILALSFGFAASASVNYGMGAWLPAFFTRTHGWSLGQIGLWMGVLTATLGPAGVLLGGRLMDRWTKAGYVDAPLRVGMLGAIGMMVCAGLYPVVPNGTVAAALLIPVNVFAALPWGAANAAIAEAMPPRLRGQGSAIYQLVVNLVAGALGPTAVAVLTDTVFGDPLAVRWSLLATTVVGMTVTLLLLGGSRRAYTRTVEGARAMADANA
jgi:MFS family permease